MKKREYKVIAVLDTIEDKLIQQSLELTAFADSYKHGDLTETLIVVPGKSVMKLCESITEKYGIDTAAIEDDGLYLPNPVVAAGMLNGIIAESRPEIVLFTHTMRNCQIVSSLSVKLNAPSVTAVESFAKSGEGYVFNRSIFNGKLKESVRLDSPLKLITVLPGAYTFAENSGPYNSGTSAFSAPALPEGAKSYEIKRYRPLSLSSDTEGGVKLEDADVIVSAGRGIGKEENLELIREAASIFSNSAVGASRPICDQKWLPFNRQVGVTGKNVSPKLYMACGISGSQQHIAGMKNSQCIVAVNKDPNAAIFSVADYIVVEDLTAFLPVLVKKYHEKFSS